MGIRDLTSVLDRSTELGGEPTRTSGAEIASVTEAVKVHGSGETCVTALNRVTLGLPRGKFTAIMGPSGSGKSTLLHCLAGLDRLTSGTVEVGGVELGALNERALTRLRRDSIGFVFQAFNLVPTLSAEENILLPHRLAGRTPDREWFDQVVSRVGLGERLGHRPSELSGGQQQRVAVARALVGRPDLIVADEPTGNLDSAAGEEVLGLFNGAVRSHQQSIVMVTHDPHAAAHADHVVFLVDGHLAGTLDAPTADSVFDRLRSFTTHA